LDPFRSIAEPILSAFPGLVLEDLAFMLAPNPEVGDIALRTFDAARRLDMSPAKLVARIAEEIDFGPEVLDVAAAGPYLNFKVDRGVIARIVVSQILEEGGRFGSGRSGAGVKALIEHTSINPNASPHVGRARNALIGDSLVRLLRFEDYETEVHYYVNDMGRQIALLTLACAGEESLSFDDMLGRYVQANDRAKADPGFAEEGYALLAKMEEGDPATREQFRRVTGLCLKGQLAVLARLGIAFDVFDRESDYIKDARLDAVLEALRGYGALFVDEDQRLVVDLSKLGYRQEEGRYFVLLRANGSSMYGYRDIAYTIDKAERGASVNLIVLGEDHKLYYEQMKLILEAAGKTMPEAVTYSHILLKEGKMSTRQGQVVLLSDFLDEATARAANKVNEQWPNLDPQQRQVIAEKVAVAAVKFAILRIGPNKNVVFDWETSLSFTGDTGPYIQYSTARISSILRKYGDVLSKTADAFPLHEDSEWMLVMKLADFPRTIASAVAQRNVAPVAQFALDAARLFSTFYHECRVIDADDLSVRAARAQLCTATLRTIENALGILGIEVLERM
jgi:arginyl-tRNA synthetase